ncbi:tyrosine-protein phosphatase [Pseudoalteromonas phenolica]|uniref:phosphatase domain-containing protein n=1 Tax=Pseudoalteromonas phenolica TaxID=161398 RepID=UPI00110B1E2A|nr:tyrosine-protein phosphatase [Pseudoalteromonas phenolica]TMO57152.1 protein phosphatase [Pseudoalteromonas phenolica]
MSLHPFDKLTVKNDISFLFTPCPGIKDANLVDSVTQLKAAGASAIVTLMSDEELEENNASTLGEVCANQDITWFQLPISDDKGPDERFFDAWQKQKSALLTLLNTSATVAVHCKGGSGRTGLMIAILLVELGYSKAEAKEKVQAMRPKALSKPDQVSFFELYQA